MAIFDAPTKLLKTSEKPNWWNSVITLWYRNTQTIRTETATTTWKSSEMCSITFDLFKVTKTSQHDAITLYQKGFIGKRQWVLKSPIHVWINPYFRHLLKWWRSALNSWCDYLIRSTISATIATPIQSAILAKKTPPTPIWQRYCIWCFVSNQNPALFHIFTTQ